MEQWRIGAADLSLDELAACLDKLDNNSFEKQKLVEDMYAYLKQWKCEHTMLKINRHPAVEAEFGNIEVCTKCGYEHSLITE